VQMKLWPLSWQGGWDSTPMSSAIIMAKAIPAAAMAAVENITAIDA